MQTNLKKNHKLGIEDHKLEDTESLLHWADVYVEVHDVNSAHFRAVEINAFSNTPWNQTTYAVAMVTNWPVNHTLGYESWPRFKVDTTQAGGKGITGKVREGRKEQILWSLGARKRRVRHDRVLIVERTNCSATLTSQINILDHIERMIQNLKMFFQPLQNPVWQIRVMWLFLHTLMHCRQ